MITAIPMHKARLAAHFTKADNLLFLDETGQEVGRFANPALGADCAGKQHLVDLILSQQADRVVVRNIGQQMLGRLLAQGLTVLHAPRGNSHIVELAHPKARLAAFTEAAHGRPSVNHDAKQKTGGCGCGHHHNDSGQPQAADGGCEQHGHRHEQGKAHSCCGGHRADNAHQHQGKGRCCHS